MNYVRFELKAAQGLIFRINLAWPQCVPPAKGWPVSYVFGSERVLDGIALPKIKRHPMYCEVMRKGWWSELVFQRPRNVSTCIPRLLIPTTGDTSARRLGRLCVIGGGVGR